MNVAIMGANSHLASDLVLRLCTAGSYQLHLFSRRPAKLQHWLAQVGLAGQCACSDYTQLREGHFDAILNFVGVGDPAHAAVMGGSIFDVTLAYDEIALSYVKQQPECKYVFLSSGAVYAGNFEGPATGETPSTIPINNLRPSDWYGAAKLHAECRHRSLGQLAIVDLRVFNYFSCTQDLRAKFFLSELLMCIQENQPFRTSRSNMVRDYLGPGDFHQLIAKVLDGPLANRALDCYSAAPVDKQTLLEHMQQRYGLQYLVADAPVGVNATGIKSHYYSINRAAADFGYCPDVRSIENIDNEFARMIGDASRYHAARMSMRS